MKLRNGYVLVTVLLLVALMSGLQLVLYKQHQQQKESYTLLQNELTAQTMLNLQQEPVNQKFNVGLVSVSDGHATVQLNNNYKYISENSANP